MLFVFRSFVKYYDFDIDFHNLVCVKLTLIGTQFINYFFRISKYLYLELFKILSFVCNVSNKL